MTKETSRPDVLKQSWSQSEGHDVVLLTPVSHLGALAGGALPRVLGIQDLLLTSVLATASTLLFFRHVPLFLAHLDLLAVMSSSRPPSVILTSSA